MSKKKLQSFEDMFGKEMLEADEKEETAGVIELDIDILVPFKAHPFKLYEGQRLDDMVESIKELGIIIPIIVRPTDDGKYEILSGHNRVNAGKIAGLEKIPTVIKEDLTDDEAFLIVTETNLIQRSFTDLTHSERASVIASRHEAMKSQGVRSDLFNEIERLSKTDEIKDFGTSAPMGRRLEAREKVGKEYNLSKNSIARYLRISKLIKPFQSCIDEGKIPIRGGVDLSYLQEEEQQLVYSVFAEIKGAKIDMKKAELIRSASKNKELTRKIAAGIIQGKIKKKKKGRPSHFKLKNKIVDKFFTPKHKSKEIEEVIEKALALYFSQQEENNSDDMKGELIGE